MFVAFRDESVRAAAQPLAVRALVQAGAHDVAMALTVLGRAPHLAHLLPLRSLTLTRVQQEPLSAYFIGSQVCGVMFHPVDARGRQVPTSHNQESLMKVMAISIHTIGLSRQEALSA